MMKTFWQLFNEHDGYESLKHNHYPEIYDEYFGPYRDQEINFLEIGVRQGGSLEIFRKYFPNANIYALEIDRDVIPGPIFKLKNTEVVIGDATNLETINQLMEKVDGKFDIILDDGSHLPEQQIATYNLLWRHLKSPGVYMVEDLVYNYNASWYKKEHTFMDFMFKKIDQFHLQDDMKPLNTTRLKFPKRDYHSIRFHRNAVVVKKEALPKNRGDQFEEIRTQSLLSKFKY